MDGREYKVCPKCSAINEKNADVCRCCGENLYNIPSVGRDFQPVPPQYQNNPAAPHYPQNQGGKAGFAPTQPPQYAGAGNPYPNNFYRPDFSAAQFPDGVTMHELELFVGKNAAAYCPKFIKKASGKKAGFSIMLFIFALFVSPIAEAFWFFHRKMNKVGAAVLAVSLALTAVSVPFAYDGMKNMADGVKIIISAADISDDGSVSPDLAKAYESLSPEKKASVQAHMIKMSKDYGISSLIGLVLTAFGIIISIFADYIYYKFALKKISAAKSKEFYTEESLCYIGGTRVWVWALILIALIVAFAVMSLAFTSSIISGIVQ